MASPIGSVNPLGTPLAAPGVGPANLAASSVRPANMGPGGAAATPSFQDFLLDSIQQVNTMQQDASRAIESLATGEEANPVEVLSAVQKADLAFRMMMQIRNKLVQAYQEVQNIRV